MFKQKTALTTVIGESSIIEGNINSKQSIKVDGIVNGNINTITAINISETGEIDGDLTCQTGRIIISGIVNGNVIAEHVKISSTGKVKGRIETSTICIEEGAIINSSIVMKINDSKEN